MRSEPPQRHSSRSKSKRNGRRFAWWWVAAGKRPRTGDRVFFGAWKGYVCFFLTTLEWGGRGQHKLTRVVIAFVWKQGFQKWICKSSLLLGNDGGRTCKLSMMHSCQWQLPKNTCPKTKHVNTCNSKRKGLSSNRRFWGVNSMLVSRSAKGGIISWPGEDTSSINPDKNWQEPFLKHFFSGKLLFFWSKTGAQNIMTHIFLKPVPAWRGFWETPIAPGIEISSSQTPHGRGYLVVGFWEDTVDTLKAGYLLVSSGC